ncbi:MAG: ABC transporter permease subunit [Clostridiaceae bacterium]|nr:ABC transporter permease subunit [Clostridiaceae bacterium]
MNIYLHELKAYRKSTIIWTCSLVLIVILFMSMFSSISQNATDFEKTLQGIPEAAQKAIGLSLDTFFSLLGFYSYLFLYVLLCGAIQAMNLGTSIISKEVREKTADFLLTKPVTRNQIMTAKLLAVLTSLVITNVVYFIASLIMVNSVKTQSFSLKIFFMISITLFFVQLMFMTIGIIISVVSPKIKSVLPISLGVVFGFFMLGMLSSNIGDTASRFLIPFKYYDYAYIIKNSSYEISFIIVEIIFILVTILASYMIYDKKDIHAV